MTQIEKNKFIRFLIKFGLDWAEIDEVKNYFANDQSHWIVLHKVIETKYNHNNKHLGITHLKLQVNLLKKFRLD